MSRMRAVDQPAHQVQRTKAVGLVRGGAGQKHLQAVGGDRDPLAPGLGQSGGDGGFGAAFDHQCGQEGDAQHHHGRQGEGQRGEHVLGQVKKTFGQGLADIQGGRGTAMARGFPCS
jgi:hypothetical protein